MATDELGPDERRFLIDLARRSLTAHVVNGRAITVGAQAGALGEPGAAFVTLRRDGELRGCIGTLARLMPLAAVVGDMAVKAGTADPRFRPVGADELPELTLEVSVLTTPVDVDGPDDVRVGKHGVIMRLGARSGLLLPQVATEHGWDALTFVRHACLKAGLPTEAWEDPGARLQVFSAIVFGEDEGPE